LTGNENLRRKNMKKKFVTGMLIAVMGATMVVFTGCSGMYRHRQDPEKRAVCVVEKISNKLDLTKEQHAKLVAIKDELMMKRGEFEPLRNALFEEVLKQTKSGKADPAEINRKLDSLETKVKEFRPILVAKFVEFHAMLTPEQRIKLAKKLEAHGKWRDK